MRTCIHVGHVEDAVRSAPVGQLKLQEVSHVCIAWIEVSAATSV